MKLGILLSLTLSCLFVLPGQGIKLNPNGGYDVVLAIDEDEPFGGLNYIDNVKEVFKRLSQKLWMSTEETFFIQSLDIVVPSSWNVEGALDGALDSISTADVRVSNRTGAPSVLNPSPCGLPGDYISLPSSFFNSANTGRYGDNAKALLVEWARYRYGAWEEHGHPGDKKFPYFTKPEVSGSSSMNETIKWRVTGCSNVELNGTFEALDGSICDAEWVGDMNKECRFRPTPNGNLAVTTSLMHFHWLESVDHFCDKDTHDTSVPNKQNYFCDYKSVLETIRSSSDFQEVDAKVTALPITRTMIHKPSAVPLLYVLLDKGYFNTDNLTGIVNVVHVEVAKLIGNDVAKNAIVGVGAFPRSEFDPSVSELVPFQKLGGNEDVFIEAIADVKTNGPKVRDFAKALQEARDVIQRASPAKGAVILIVKTGLPSDFLSTPYEKEVETALLSENIRLFAIEVSGWNNTAQSLERLALATSGSSVAITTPRITAEVTALIKSVSDSITEGVVLPTATSPQIIWQGPVDSHQHVKFPVPKGSDGVTVTLIHPEAETIGSVGYGAIAEEFVELSESMAEWGEHDGVSRFISYGTIVPTNVSELIFVFTVPSNVSGHLIVTSRGDELPEEYQIRVTTTAVEGVLDFNKTGNSDIPFVISVYVTQGDIPVVGVKVLAHLKLSSSAGPSTYTLKDDGLGNPDVGEGDGIYSGIVIPTADGSYSVSVEVIATGSTTLKSQGQRSSAQSGRLLPVDQSEEDEFGETVTPTESFTKTAVLLQGIQVRNFALFKNAGKPLPIRDLIVAEGLNSMLFLNFTAPQILGQPGATPKRYALYQAAKKEDLINLDLSQPLPSEVELAEEFQTSNDMPETRVSFPFTKARDGFFFMTVVSWNGDKYSAKSNIQSKDTKAVPLLPTTTEDPANGGSSTTEEGEGEESKAWIKSTGGIITVVVIVLVVFAAAGGAYWYLKRKRSGKTITNP